MPHCRETQPDSLYTEPKTEHSRKPVWFAEQIERQWPELRKLELFQRKASLAEGDIASMACGTFGAIRPVRLREISHECAYRESLCQRGNFCGGYGRAERAYIIDSFAGGGGASTGIEQALRRSPDYAINHNAAALALHAVNHPNTIHLSENVYRIDPLDHLRGKHIGLAWFSPDCKHFSKAKGGKLSSATFAIFAGSFQDGSSVSSKAAARSMSSSWKTWKSSRTTGR